MSAWARALVCRAELPKEPRALRPPLGLQGKGRDISKSSLGRKEVGWGSVAWNWGEENGPSPLVFAGRQGCAAYILRTFTEHPHVGHWQA